MISISIGRTLLVMIIVFLLIVVSVIAVLFVGDFGTGYKVEVTGEIYDLGLIHGFVIDDLGLRDIRIGSPVKDTKLLSFSPAFTMPWEGNLNVRILIDNPNDPFQFAHPYDTSVGTIDFLAIGGDNVRFSITVRHLEQGVTHSGYIELYQSGILFSSEKVLAQESIDITI